MCTVWNVLKTVRPYRTVKQLTQKVSKNNSYHSNTKQSKIHIKNSTVTKVIRTVVNGYAYKNVARDVEGIVEYWLANILLIHIKRVVF